MSVLRCAPLQNVHMLVQQDSCTTITFPKAYLLLLSSLFVIIVIFVIVVIMVIFVRIVYRIIVVSVYRNADISIDYY